MEELKDKVLLEFIRDIDDTGGIAVNDDGVEAPVADPAWTDLAETYRKACKAMTREPVVSNLEDEDCRYCGGNCPNEPPGSNNLCDGFAGDVDNLYAGDDDDDERRGHSGKGRPGKARSSCQEQVSS